MVIFFNTEGEIQAVEHFVMSPKLPENMSLIDKIIYYNNQGLDFVCLNYEFGSDALNYRVAIDEDTNFIGLQPKKEGE